MSRHRNAKHLIEEDYGDYEDDYGDGYDDQYDDYEEYPNPPARTNASASASASTQKQQPQTSKAKAKQNQLQKGNQQKSATGPSKQTPTPTKNKPEQSSPVKNKTVEKPMQQQQPQQQILSTFPAPSNLKLTPGTYGTGSNVPGQDRLMPSNIQSPVCVGKQAAKIPDVLLQPTITSSNPKMTPKIPLTVVVLGHVDAGKSTIAGNLLVGGTKQRGGAATRNYAWLLDEDENERDHGVTMDIATKQLDENLTTNFQIVLQDAPGHADYIPAMITGTAAADAALLTVDATDLGTALSRGQLREHMYLARGLGVNQIIVVFNKMDLVGWDNQAAYLAMESQLQHFLTKQVGYKAERVRCVPVSGLTGVNIFPGKSNDDTKKLNAWYNGPTLLEALDTFESPVQQQQKLLEKPVRIVVTDVVDGGGVVSVRAKVAQGWAKQGETLTVIPSGDPCVLTKLSSLHQNPQSDTRRQYCAVGEFIDCTLTGLDPQRISTGSVLARPNTGPQLARRCRARVFVLDGLTIPLIRGAQVVFHMHSLDIPCSLAIVHRTLKGDGVSTLKENPRALTKSCIAIVELQLAFSICIEAFSECRALGQFVLRRSGGSIAIGRIEEVIY